MKFSLIYLFGCLAAPIASVAQAKPRMIIQNSPSLAPYRLTWAANDQLIVTKSRRGELRVWSTDGTLLQSLAPLDHTDSSVTTSSDGRFLAGCGQGKAMVIDRIKDLVLWESKTAEIVSIADLEPPWVTVATSAMVQRINFETDEVSSDWKPRQDEGVKQITALPGGLAVFIHNRSAVVLDKQLSEKQRVQHVRPGQYYSGASGGGTLALSTFDGAYLVTPAAGEQQWQGISSKPAIATAISPDGTSLAVCSLPGSLDIYSVSDPKEPRHIEGVNEVSAIAWSADGTRLALATTQQGIVICNVKSGQVLRRFGAAAGMEPLDVADKVTMSGDSAVITMVKEDEAVSCVSLTEGSVQRFDPNQAVQPPTRTASAANSDIILLTPSGLRFQRDGRLIEKFGPASSLLFDSGPCGGHATYFRNNSSVTVFSVTAEGSAETGSFPLGVGLRCVFAADGSTAIHDDSPGAELIVREAPSWKIAAKIPKAPGHYSVAAIARERSPDAYTWLDDRGGIHRYEIANSQVTSLRAPGSLDCPLFRSCVLPADWFITQRPFSNPIDFAIHATKDGRLLHQKKPWKAFTDEIDLEVIGVSKNRRGLWLCGHAGRLILVDLESGQPVLRLHLFGPGEYLWETPDGEVGGSSEILAHKQCYFLSPDGMSAKPEPQAVQWRATLAEDVLKGFN